MSPEYLLMRHGQSEVNVTKTICNSPAIHAPLTDLGRKQADEFIENVLGQRHVTSVESSPLTRAEETAKRIADKFGLKVKMYDALREPYCGIIEGRNDGEAWAKHTTQEEEWRKGNYDYHIPDGESLTDVINRFRLYFEELVERRKRDEGTVVIVSHGSTLRNTIPFIVSNITRDYAHSHSLNNCGYMLVDMQDNQLVCREWNGEPVPLKP